jgi:hypothetical protein
MVSGEFIRTIAVAAQKSAINYDARRIAPDRRRVSEKRFDAPRRATPTWRGPMNEPPPNRNERDLLFIVKLSSALGLGVLAGFLYSLKEVHPGIRFEVTFGTFLIALAVAVASWFFCGIMARADAEEHPTVARRRFFVRWLIYFGGTCTVGTIFAFAWSLRNVSTRGKRDVIEGTVLAVLVLAAGGFLIHKAFRFFEEQDKASLDEQRREEEETDD